MWGLRKIAELIFGIRFGYLVGAMLIVTWLVCLGFVTYLTR